MIPYLGCESAREMLEAFVDGELPMQDQVAVESHLRWCTTCSARVDDMRLIGEAIRVGGFGAHSRDYAEERELAALHGAVLSRFRAEHEQSFTMQVRGLFQDMHLFWAGLGATAAVIVCLFGAVGVLHAASDERPDSLAGVIQSLANPGSDRNPLRLDGRMIQVPRALDDSPALEMGEDEAVFALAAVVTREGRIANYEVLVSERDGARRDGAGQESDVTTLLDKVARSRFAPAERGVARAPVAVNMIWLLARTTVKGTPQIPLDFQAPAKPVAAEPLAPAVKPAAGVEEQPLTQHRRLRRSTTA